jgi:hypothetical protein
MIKTIISSAKQDAIEPFKPVFMFGFVDAPQFVATECRGRIAHMIGRSKDRNGRKTV